MEEHPIQGLMETAMSNIKSMVSVDTVIGEPMTVSEGTVIVPVSTVSFGFGAGGSDFEPKNYTKFTEKMFGGGCGGGANVKPMGFLVITNGNVRYMPMSQSSTAVDKIVDMVPEMIDKVNGVIKEHRKKKKAAKEEQLQGEF